LNIKHEDILKKYLLDDIGFGDITTESLIDRDLRIDGEIKCHEEAVIAGLEEANLLYKSLNCEVEFIFKDGDKVKPNDVIMNVSGYATDILVGERTILNIIGRMSGIATLTKNYVDRVRNVNQKVIIAATRKTVPGFNIFDKKAVMIGGGDTHRFRLDDMILIKDNHIVLLGSITEAIKTIKNKISFTKKIEIEVESVENAYEAIDCGADIIMLDNMIIQDVAKIIEYLKTKNMRQNIMLEVSGGITKNNIIDYAKTGIDIISLGELTHSVKSIDVSLTLQEKDKHIN